MSALIPFWTRRKRQRGRSWRCGWCDRKRWSRQFVVEARVWRLCTDCADIFRSES